MLTSPLRDWSLIKGRRGGGGYKAGGGGGQMKILFLEGEGGGHKDFPPFNTGAGGA